jgi:mandelate racemase
LWIYEHTYGVVGSAYIFTYSRLALASTARLVENLGPLPVNAPVAPFEIEQNLRRQFRLLGPQGLTAMAKRWQMAVIDMAAWDALDLLHGVPLARLLGGQPQRIRSCRSLGMEVPDAAARQVEDAAKSGFRAAKIRLGFADLEDDRAVVQALRRRSVTGSN